MSKQYSNLYYDSYSIVEIIRVHASNLKSTIWTDQIWTTDKRPEISNHWYSVIIKICVFMGRL